MAAAALFEARVGHHHQAIIAGIDAVRTAQPAIAAAEAREGRAVDRQRRLRVVRGEYPLFPAAKQAVDDVEIAAFEPDAGAIAVGNAHLLKDDAGNARPVPRQPHPPLPPPQTETQAGGE